MVSNLVAMTLKHRLQLEAWRADHAELDNERICNPLIIVGLPRTGTTFLHQLLFQDPQFRSPLRFEIEQPVPPPMENAVSCDPRVVRVQRGIDVIHRIVPHFMDIHPMAAHFPDECQQITAYQFSSMGLQHIIDAPSYQQWLLAHDFTQDLEFHRGFLQHLQSAWQRQRWLLKSPAHVQYLPTLLKIYPDAMIIHTHRNPQEIMGSVSSLSWTMQNVFSDHANPAHAGEGQLRYFTEVTRMCLEDRDALGDRDEIYDVRYTELVVDPLAMVRQVYRHFKLDLTAEAEAAMASYIATNRQGKHGKHRYDPAIFGVDGLDDVDVFQRYRQRFGV